MLINNTKKTVYFGCSDNLLKSLKWHIECNCDATENWDFDNDDIRLEKIDSHLTEQTAQKSKRSYQEEIAQLIEDYHIHLN